MALKRFVAGRAWKEELRLHGGGKAGLSSSSRWPHGRGTARRPLAEKSPRLPPPAPGFYFLGPPPDFLGPPLDFLGPSLDFLNPPPDLSGPSLDFLGTPPDFLGPPPDLSGPPPDLPLGFTPLRARGGIEIPRRPRFPSGEGGEKAPRRLREVLRGKARRPHGSFPPSPGSGQRPTSRGSAARSGTGPRRNRDAAGPALSSHRPGVEGPDPAQASFVIGIIAPRGTPRGFLLRGSRRKDLKASAPRPSRAPLLPFTSPPLRAASISI